MLFAISVKDQMKYTTTPEKDQKMKLTSGTL